MLNPKLRVSGQLGIGPYFILLPGVSKPSLISSIHILLLDQTCADHLTPYFSLLLFSFHLNQIFYTHQLLDNPDQPGATNFRANLVDAYNVAHLSEPLPVSIRISKLLASTSFIAPPPPRGRNAVAALATAIEEGRSNEDIARDRIKMLKRITFPYTGLQPDVHGCDVEDVFPAGSADDGASPNGSSGATTNDKEHAASACTSGAAGGMRVSELDRREDGEGLPPDIARGVQLFHDNSQA